MKKILLTTLTLASFGVYAQNSVLFTNKEVKTGPIKHKGTKAADFRTKSQKHTRATEGWISYQDAVAQDAVASTAWYPMTHDSNGLVTPSTGTPFNWWLHGLGTSLDVTSEKFKAPVSSTYTQNFQIDNTRGYTVDSINVLGFYDRPNNNGVDTLWVEVASVGATSPGTTVLQSKDVWYLTNLGLSDSTMRWATASYDYMNNRMASTVTNKQVIRVLLNAASVGDTNANGYTSWVLKLPTPLNVLPGEKVTTYVHFRAGVTQPLNTDFNTVNKVYLLCQESEGASTLPKPKEKEIVSGIINTTGDRYRLLTASGANDYVLVSGVQYSGPTYWYTAPAKYDDPYFAFYVKCPTCFYTGTNDIAKNITVQALNPVKDVATFNVSLLNSVKNINITLSNTVGQTVKAQNFGSLNASINRSFNMDVSNLTNGVYIYTINADGNSYTNKLVINK